MAYSARPSLQTGRLHYLDNLRVFCMVFGVFFHAQFMGDFGLLGDIFGISPYFRMQLFFWVSGFFAALLMAKLSLSDFYRARLVVLGVPLISALLILNPVVIYVKRGLVDRVDYGSYTFNEALSYVHTWEPGGVFLHLWFLQVLIVFVLAAPAMRWAAMWLNTPLERLRPSLIPVVLGGGIVVCWLLFRASFRIFEADIPRLVGFLGHYLPYFACGLMCFQAPHAFAAMHRFNPALCLSAGLLLAIDLAQLYRGPGWGLVHGAAQGLVAFAMIHVALIISARYLNYRTRISTFFSERIYSIYLLHLLGLYGIAWAMGWYQGDMSRMAFLITCGATLGLCVAVDVAVIGKSRVLTFMFSGRNMAAVQARTTALKQVAP